MDFHALRRHCPRLLLLAIIISISKGSPESISTSSAQELDGRRGAQSHSITKRNSDDVFDKRFYSDEGRKRTRNTLYNFFSSVGIRSPSKHIHRFVGKRTSERNNVPVHVLSPAFAMSPIFGKEFARYVRRIPRLSLAFVGKRRIKPFISRRFPAYEHKFIGKRSSLLDDDNDDVLNDKFDSLKWPDVESKAQTESVFPQRIEDDVELGTYENSMFNKYIMNFLNDRSTSHSLSKRDVSSLDQELSSRDTSKFDDSSDIGYLNDFISILNNDAREDDKSYNVLNSGEENMSQEFEKSDDKQGSAFRSYVEKRLPDFHAFIGKRTPSSHSYVGKRFNKFHSYVGKRAPDFHAYIGKRAPHLHAYGADFHAFVGKRDFSSSAFDEKRVPDFHAFIGKRVPDFHAFIGKRLPDFHAYVGKRIPDFHAFIGKRMSASNSYVDKRVPDFHAFVGKRAPDFHAYIGKRSRFHAYVGKRMPDFHAFIGKRIPDFHAFIGKRDPESPDSLQEKRARESDLPSAGDLGDLEVDTHDMEGQMNNRDRFLSLIGNNNAYFASDIDHAADTVSFPSRMVDGDSISVNENLAKSILRDTMLSQKDASVASESSSASSNGNSSVGSAAKT